MLRNLSSYSSNYHLQGKLKNISQLHGLTFLSFPRFFKRVKTNLNARLPTVKDGAFLSCSSLRCLTSRYKICFITFTLHLILFSSFIGLRTTRGASVAPLSRWKLTKQSAVFALRQSSIFRTKLFATRYCRMYLLIL